MTTEAEGLGLIDLPQLEWPITYRYTVRLPWGYTRQVLTVNALGLGDSPDRAVELGRQLWTRTVAPATSRHVELVTHDTVAWRFFPAALPMAHVATYGLISQEPALPEETPCVVLDTRIRGTRRFRRFFIGGAPRSWVVGRQLTWGGMYALEGWCQLALMGLRSRHHGGPFEWLVHYPHALTPTMENPSGVGFRRVTDLRLCSYTSKAPDPSGEPWP